MLSPFQNALPNGLQFSRSSRNVLYIHRRPLLPKLTQERLLHLVPVVRQRRKRRREFKERVPGRNPRSSPILSFGVVRCRTRLLDIGSYEGLPTCQRTRFELRQKQGWRFPDQKWPRSQLLSRSLG